MEKDFLFIVKMGVPMRKQYKLTLLSPVHIGSGDKLSKNYDYFTDIKGTCLLDIDRFFQSLTPIQISQFNGNEHIIDFMKMNKIDKYKFIKKRISPQQANINEMNIFIKDCYDNPYIPGSSIKGAMRTVIAQHIFKTNKLRFNMGERSKKEWAFSLLDEHIFGKNPNYDFLKGLMVVDSFFKESDLTIYLAKIFSLKKDKTLSIKYDKNKKEMNIMSEFLKILSVSTVDIKIDDFFFSSSIMKELGIEPHKKEVLLEFPRIANEYAKRRIEKELAFFSGQNNLKSIIQFYTGLMKTIEQCNSDSFVLNLGWGTGWQFKTGDYIGENDLDKIRRKFDLGKIVKRCPQNHDNKEWEYSRNRKYYCNECRREYSQDQVNHFIKPFPKSRKILYDHSENQGKPFSVPGWVKLTEVQ